MTSEREQQRLRTGATNSLADVPGLRVGHETRTGDGWLTGTTVILAPPGGMVAGVDVRGGGPGTRETDLLDPRNVVERIHAITLTGGSAFGLAAADGVMGGLYEDGVGMPMGAPGQVVPLVPAAVIFDLGRGGEFGNRPSAQTGRAAYRAACVARPGDAVAHGVVGAGTGAKAGGFKGGVGGASTVLPDGTRIAALLVLNPVGDAVDPATGDLYGRRHLLPGEAPMLGVPTPEEAAAARAAAEHLNVPAPLPRPGTATTIGVLATDASLTKAQCAKLAGIAHDGLARGVDPVHTMLDGDTFFGVSTANRAAPDAAGFHDLLVAGARTVTRAVVHAMLTARSVSTPGGAWRCYTDAFPTAVSRRPEIGKG